MSNRSAGSYDNNSFSSGTFNRNVDATNMNAEKFMTYDLELNGDSDTGWDEMLDEFNRIDRQSRASIDKTDKNELPSPQVRASDNIPQQEKTQYSADSFEDSGDGFDEDIAYPEAGTTEDSGISGENAESQESDEAVFGKNDATDNKSRGSNVAGRLLALLAAAVFVAGIFFIIKLSDSSSEKIPLSDNGVQSGVSDSDTVENAGASPDGADSDGISEEEVSSEEEPPVQEPEKVYKELNFGDRNDDVLNMQNRLRELGYVTEASCTGYYGNFTKSKIEAFQSAAGLPVTGTADSATLSRLYADDAPKAN